MAFRRLTGILASLASQALTRLKIGRRSRCPQGRPNRNKQVDLTYEPRTEDYPIFPPPPPEEILREAVVYHDAVQARKFAAPRGVFEDTSLFALYRLYEFIVLDKRFAYRNLIEWLWRQHHWKVHDIPDPEDDDPSRYAFLAGVTYLLVKAFNERIANGLRRGKSPLISMEEIEQARGQPESERPYEQVPSWAEKVPPLEETLVIPTDEGVILEGKEDKRADPDFLCKNILLWTPHIWFT